MKTLRREPARSSQICGYQIQIGSWNNAGSEFCGERKAPGLYFCQEHHDWVLLDEPDQLTIIEPDWGPSEVLWRVLAAAVR